MKKMLIVDDDAHIRNLVKVYAELDGFECSEAGDADQALKFVSESDYDILILDIMMPGRDGYATLAEIRKYSQVPVIMLTARSEEYDKLMGFSLGADDYVSKPFSPKELMARVGAVLKRSRNERNLIIKAGELSIRTDTRLVVAGGKTINLPPKEFDLLVKLAQNEHIVLTREQLMDSVWGYEYYGDSRTVDTHVKSLREHLGEYRKLIQTVWGVGYKFEHKE
nr:response regulator transcription factor [uncultured Acetatifactor sp.]